MQFQSTRLSQASTIILLFLPLHSMYFNPQGSREPRLEKHHIFGGANRFQYTRLSRASTRIPCNFPVSISISIHKALASLDHRWILSLRIATIFQSTRLSRASTAFSSKCPFSSWHFNPQGSREPRRLQIRSHPAHTYFNPQGSREPRLSCVKVEPSKRVFQSTRLSRASTWRQRS